MLRPRLLPVAARPAPRPLALPSIDLRPLLRAAPVAVLFAVYLAVGLAFSLGAGIVIGDAWSRVGNAYYVLFSRDPHLAAIGFVWNPLPSILELPILVFSSIWRPLVDHGVAANLMSAACMALAVRELWLWLRDLIASRAVRIGLTAAFAAHPLILLYGGNGMSEAPFLLFLLVAGRAFSEWVGNGAVGRLAVTGLALALAYLTRYEAVAPIAAIGLLTLVVSYRLARGTRREKAIEAVADGLIVGMPPVGAFVAWALASWIIVGSPFATFTSVYGNSSQVSASLEGIRSATGGTPQAAAAYVGQQMLGLEALLPVIAILALAVGFVRRDARVLVPFAVFGSVLTFSIALFIGGGSFGWLRFSIAVIPLAVILAGMSIPRAGGAGVWLGRLPGAGALIRSVSAVGLVALTVGALPRAVDVVFDQRLAREESPQLAGLIAGESEMPDARRQYLAAGNVARYLDAQNLPRGSVVLDVAIGFPIVLQSTNPDQFVITPDRDFDRVVADPQIFGARYVLAPYTQGYSVFDAVGRAHPGFYRDGAGIATLAAEFSGGNDASTWRVYAVKP